LEDGVRFPSTPVSVGKATSSRPTRFSPPALLLVSSPIFSFPSTVVCKLYIDNMLLNVGLTAWSSGTVRSLSHSHRCTINPTPWSQPIRKNPGLCACSWMLQESFKVSIVCGAWLHVKCLPVPLAVRPLVGLYRSIDPLLSVPSLVLARVGTHHLRTDALTVYKSHVSSTRYSPCPTHLPTFHHTQYAWLPVTNCIDGFH
jgi:hypothetical protein